MYDDLARIERSYGSVAEYNRCREEADAEQYEREMNYRNSCAKNKAKLESAGERAMYFCEDCIGCKYYEMVGPTSPGFGLEDIDDVEHGICHHKAKPFLNVEEPFCSGREEGEWDATRDDIQ